MVEDSPIQVDDLVFHPLTARRWEDLETLFGSHGACAGCWCMFWRLPRKEFGQNCRDSGAANRQAMRSLVHSGIIPGIIGYQAGQPVVWCSIAPREDFASLERSRNLKRLDGQPVWSIVCFYTARAARGSGRMLAAIRAAVEYARRSGAKMVEAYPTPVDGHRAPGDLYMGSLDTFIKAGFKEIETRGAHRIVRIEL